MSTTEQDSPDRVDAGLDWPEGYPRTEPSDRESYPGDLEPTRKESFQSIVEELERWGASGIRISTASQHYVDRPNIPHQHDKPDDVGVVVRFRKTGERADQEYAIACDQWQTQRENARAIALYVQRKRLAERCGVTTAQDEVDVAALPPGEGDAGATAVQPDGTIGGGVDDGLDQEPHEVLGVSEGAPEPVIRGAFRELAKEGHEDQGADERYDVAELKQARDEMLEN